MKKSFFSVPRTLPLHALTTFLIGVGCVWPLSLSLGLTAPLSLCLTACGAVTLLFALLDCMPRLRALAYPLLVPAGFIVLSVGIHRGDSMVKILGGVLLAAALVMGINQMLPERRD